MGKIIGAIVLGLIAIACFVGSYFQFKEKGFLFNNAYIYASKEERERMNKTPHDSRCIVYDYLCDCFIHTD